MAAEQKNMQPIVRTVRVSSFFVHCYLACGHMVTMPQEYLKESSPTSSPASIECWACEEESKNGLSSK
jgi:hypothetical protein